MKGARRYLLAGVLTLIPILVTIFVFSFFLNLLSDIGRPKVRLIANAVRPLSPEVARSLMDVPWLQSALAIVLTLVMFYLLGLAVSRMVGRRLLLLIEAWLERIPLVTTVYGATKQLIETFQSDHGKSQRVVLIEFPRPGMKAVGFVTRTLVDDTDASELASVYVPTAPNPTGGYLVIVPTDALIPLDWSVDEAMTFVVSGGATSPGSIRWTRPVDASAQFRAGATKNTAADNRATVSESTPTPSSDVAGQ
ncbi:MAG: DUF502 domain-containing protein [Thiohalocapsa sp.]